MDAFVDRNRGATHANAPERHQHSWPARIKALSCCLRLFLGQKDLGAALAFLL
jgi:hypothetical protein